MGPKIFFKKSHPSVVLSLTKDFKSTLFMGNSKWQLSLKILTHLLLVLLYLYLTEEDVKINQA